MPSLTDKTILILSPQSWGKMFISKHHYALELARQGNTVFFLNPPEYGPSDLRSGIRIDPSGIHPGLFLIRHRLWFPYLLKFHAMPLFHAGMRIQLKRILRRIARAGHPTNPDVASRAAGPIDIVWSFDLGNLCPLTFFDRSVYKVFHPVDEPSGPSAIRAAKGADIIFSVTSEILEKYKNYPAPKYFINHGVSEEFLVAPPAASRTQGDLIRTGMAGNLMRADIDRPTFLQIIRENPSVIFECWGSYTGGQSNIGGGGDKETQEFISTLRSMPNVVLHGAVPAAELPSGFARMDAFLICYDIIKDQSGGTNYHKIIEYLSTGKVIVSNNVTTYKDLPVLMQMTRERDNNRQLAPLFKRVIADLSTHNAPARQSERIAFARDNTYCRQVERIGRLIVQPAIEPFRHSGQDPRPAQPNPSLHDK